MIFIFSLLLSFAHAGDPYQTLGVSRTADAQQIKAAYRKRAQELHPDKTQGRTEAEFKALGMAYDILRDPYKRSDYDRTSGAQSYRAQARSDFENRLMTRYFTFANSFARARNESFFANSLRAFYAFFYDPDGKFRPVNEAYIEVMEGRMPGPDVDFQYQRAFEECWRLTAIIPRPHDFAKVPDPMFNRDLIVGLTEIMRQNIKLGNSDYDTHVEEFYKAALETLPRISISDASPIFYLLAVLELDDAFPTRKTMGTAWPNFLQSVQTAVDQAKGSGLEDDLKKYQARLRGERRFPRQLPDCEELLFKFKGIVVK